ncbi:MAG: carboxypeptidase regulatory-like domain-containing protein [bacterium]
MPFRLAATALLGLCPAMLLAQSIRGTVVAQGDSAAIPGAVVLLVNRADSVVARALTNDRGEYRVVAPAAGTYRLRTLRIGFRPVLSDAVELSAGQDVTRRFSFANIPFAMDTVRVVGANACRGVADSAMTAFSVWDQVRTALTATQLTALDRSLVSTAVQFERVVDPVRDKVTRETARLQTQYARRPWATLPPDSLRRVGYVVTDTEGDVTYYAPDLDVLVSDAFVVDHCFRLVSARDTAMIGLAFEPTRDRGRVPEIRGTLWINRRTSELHDLEYRYANISKLQSDGRAGGNMGFVRMLNGAWMISRWDIRMPVQEQYLAGGFGKARTQDVRLAEIRVTGGDLALVRRGRDTLFTGAGVLLSGTVADSATGKPVSGARVTLLGTRHETQSDGEGRFRLTSVLPGNYEIVVRTPSLDSLSTAVQLPFAMTGETVLPEIHVPTTDQLAMMMCGNRRVGVVAGTAKLRGDTLPPGTIKVSVEWPDAVQGQARALETRADSSGRFRVCGVPVNTALVVRLSGDSILAEPMERRIAQGLIARADVLVERHVNRGAVLAGLVLTDSTRKPIADVEVVVPSLSLRTRTNERGEFRIGDIAPGTHQVIARRFGYGPLDASVSFVANETVDRRIFLTRIAMLDTVSVTARSSARGNGLAAFEERRRKGFGKFIDSTELKKNENRRLGDMMASMQGVTLVAPPMCSLTGLRYPRCVLSGNARVAFSNRGRGCAMQVLVDGVVIYRSKQEDKDWALMFDLNNFLSVADLAAVEVYRSSTEVPMEYGNGSGPCGVLVLWTKRG